jgi:hypothetical protein
MPTASTNTLGRTRNAALPIQATSSIHRIARIERYRRAIGDSSDPASRQMPNAARSAPIAPPLRPCSRPATTITSRIPGRAKLPRP